MRTLRRDGCFAMADYRRCYMPDVSFFFTVVTERRAAIFGDDLSRDLLRGIAGLPATLAAPGGRTGHATRSPRRRLDLAVGRHRLL